MSDAREKLLQALKSEEVEFEDRGIKVKVRELTGDERDTLLEQFYDHDEDGKLRPKPDASRRIMSHLVCLCTLNGDGKRMFEDDDKAVGRISAHVKDTLGNRILAISGLGESDAEARAGN